MLTSAEQDKRKRLEAPIFALKQTKAFFYYPAYNKNEI